MKLKLPNVPAILRGAIKAAFLRWVYPLELAGTKYDPEQMAKETMLERMEVGPGGFELVIQQDEGHPFRVLLDAFARFALEGALNYREFSLRWRAAGESGDDLPCTVTVQRTMGLTPHEARQKVERELLAVRGQLEELQHQQEEFKRIEPEDWMTMGGTMRNVRELCAEIRRIDKFKAYVHKRLDDAGVPVDPESPHKAEGCRIGGRLDWLLAELQRQRALKQEYLGDLHNAADDAPARQRLLALMQTNAELGTATVEALVKADELAAALHVAEAALADIGDATREPGDDLAWCEARAAKVLPGIREVLTKHKPE